MLRSPKRRRFDSELLLRTLLAVVVVASLVFAGLAFRGLSDRADALRQAQAETAHQVRLQTVSTKLVVADAAAGVDVLLGPQQPRLTGRTYEYALQPAVIGLPIASRQADDAFTLAVANLRLAQYAGTVDSARTLARQQDDGAAAQLVAASTALRSEVLPRIGSIQAASAVRLADEQAAADRGSVLLTVVAVPALVVLLGVHLLLTRRTRRLLNTGLAVGIVAVLAASVFSGVVAVRSQGEVSAVSDRLLPTVQHLVAARDAAFEARAVEALSVVEQRPAAREQAWQAAYRRALAELAEAVAVDPAAAAEVQAIRDALQGKPAAADQPGLPGYAPVHARLVAAPTPAQAVAIATSPTVEGSVGSFEDVDNYSGALLARRVQAADDAWTRAGAHLELASWVCLACGAGAALLGGLGLNRRLREYAG